MKKTLFASTAVAALSFGGAASAAGLEATVGGYWYIGAGYDSGLVSFENPAGASGVTILRDGEIFLGVTGSTDNGLTFDGRVELESFTSGDQIDENWARVSGSFGSVLIGGEDTTSDNHEAGIFYGPGARTGYFDAFVSVIGSSNAGDLIGITYESPNISGFSVGGSYHLAGTDGAGDQGRVTKQIEDDIYSFGADYSGEFSGVSLDVAGGIVNGDGIEDVVFQVGTTIAYQGVSLGVHYDSNASGLETDGVDLTDDDGALAVGVQYTTGPWTVAGGYAFNFNDEDFVDANNFGGWVTYALGPGVSATFGIEGNDGGSAEDTDIVALGYLALSF
ncbi:MAG: porin [Pseudomonadota bacterium]